MRRSKVQQVADKEFFDESSTQLSHYDDEMLLGQEKAARNDVVRFYLGGIRHGAYAYRNNPGKSEAHLAFREADKKVESVELQSVELFEQARRLAQGMVALIEKKSEQEREELSREYWRNLMPTMEELNYLLYGTEAPIEYLATRALMGTFLPMYAKAGLKDENIRTIVEKYNMKTEGLDILVEISGLTKRSTR